MPFPAVLGSGLLTLCSATRVANPLAFEHGNQETLGGKVGARSRWVCLEHVETDSCVELVPGSFVAHAWSHSFWRHFFSWILGDTLPTETFGDHWGNWGLDHLLRSTCINRYRLCLYDVLKWSFNIIHIFLPCTVDRVQGLSSNIRGSGGFHHSDRQVTPDRNNAFFLPMVQGWADFWGVHTSHPLTVTEPHKGYR